MRTTRTPPSDSETARIFAIRSSISACSCISRGAPRARSSATAGSAASTAGVSGSPIPKAAPSTPTTTTRGGARPSARRARACRAIENACVEASPRSRGSGPSPASMRCTVPAAAPERDRVDDHDELEPVPRVEQPGRLFVAVEHRRAAARRRSATSGPTASSPR